MENSVLTLFAAFLSLCVARSEQAVSDAVWDAACAHTEDGSAAFFTLCRVSEEHQGKALKAEEHYTFLLSTDPEERDLLAQGRG